MRKIILILEDDNKDCITEAYKVSEITEHYHYLSDTPVRIRAKIIKEIPVMIGQTFDGK